MTITDEKIKAELVERLGPDFDLYLNMASCLDGLYEIAATIGLYKELSDALDQIETALVKKTGISSWQYVMLELI